MFWMCSCSSVTCHMRLRWVMWSLVCLMYWCQHLHCSLSYLPLCFQQRPVTDSHSPSLLLLHWGLCANSTNYTTLAGVLNCGLEVFSMSGEKLHSDRNSRASPWHEDATADSCASSMVVKGEYAEQVILNCRRRWYSKLANMALWILIHSNFHRNELLRVNAAF